MKTSRERVMAFLALGLITLTLSGVFYFLYYDKNMSGLKTREASLQADLNRDTQALDDFEDSLPRLELARRMSLPAKPDVAGTLYDSELRKMLRESGFPAGKTTVNSKSQEARATGASAKKPTFLKLVFDAAVHGDESMLVDFLERFYRTPLLHRIKSLTVSRPLGLSPGQMTYELDINVTIEALILDGAEDRETLLPKGLKESDIPKRNARGSSQYATIAGNNIFYGPPTQTRDLSGSANRIETILPDIELTMIEFNDRGPVLHFFDAVNEYRYQIRKRYDGNYYVDKYWFTAKNEPKPLEIGEKKLEFKDAKEHLHRSFNVVRIDGRDVFLEENDKYYRLHIGDRVSDAKLLKKEEIQALGIKPKDEKKPAEKKDAGK